MARLLGVFTILTFLLSCSESESLSDAMQSSSGVSEPSIVETVRFIGNLASVSELKLPSDKVEFSPEKPCVVTYTPSPGIESWVVDFSLMNPDAVELHEDDRFVVVRATNGENVIRTKDPTTQSAKPRDGGRGRLPENSVVVPAMIKTYNPYNDLAFNSINFYVPDGPEDNVRKVGNALKHLIRKCGGKGDLFK